MVCRVPFEMGFANRGFVMRYDLISPNIAFGEFQDIVKSGKIYVVWQDLVICTKRAVKHNSEGIYW